MTTSDNDIPAFLAPPAVTTLRQSEVEGRAPMERTLSMNIRTEREELKEAAEQSLNVILDLSLDGLIRWVSPSWKEVIGNPADSVVGKPIVDLLLSSKDAFVDALESMKKDDSRSQIVRFRVRMGPSSVLRKEPEGDENEESEGSRTGDDGPEDESLSLEGQGIMVYDRSSGEDSHVSATLLSNRGRR